MSGGIRTWPGNESEISQINPESYFGSADKDIDEIENGRADREEGLAARRAKPIPYLQPISAWRRDMIWKCKVLHFKG